MYNSFFAVEHVIRDITLCNSFSISAVIKVSDIKNTKHSALPFSVLFASYQPPETLKEVLCGVVWEKLMWRRL